MFLNVPSSALVYRLHKAIYELMQAPRAWFARLSTSLHGLDFTFSKTDTSLFLCFHQDSTIFILVYVGDIIIANNNGTDIKTLIRLLRQDFSLKDLGDLNYFLGIQAIRHGSDKILAQEKYITDLLARANSVTTPMVTGLPLSKTRGDPIENITAYCRLVGGLQYATITQPDIAYSVNKVS